MSNLATFKTKLLEEAITYTQYLETILKTDTNAVSYPIAQVKAIEHIINNSNRCKGLQLALTQQMEQHLNPKRSLGERWRSVFSC